MRTGLAEGIRLFNEGAYFEAHEVLEDVWRAAPVQDKTFLQGLVQLAVAFHHRSTENLAGAASVLRKASRNLEQEPASAIGVDVASLRAAVQDWVRALADGAGLASPPRIPFINDDEDTSSSA